jgi:hypothetical protein
MNHSLRIALNGTPKQFERLRALQVAFADVCNAIAPVVQSTRCWNRVALHHLVYRSMRERFPALGSQMICNAVYSVARNARLVLQHPQSPWNVSKRSAAAPLPLLRFAASAPVYFDRHTLSLRRGMLSMFTLDGRMRFDLSLAPADETRFHQEKLIEVMLAATASGFELTFQFAGTVPAGKLQEMSAKGLLPEYVLIIPPEAATPLPPAPAEVSPQHGESDRRAAC